MFTKYKHKGSAHLYKKTVDWEAVGGAIVLGIIGLVILANL